MNLFSRAGALSFALQQEAVRCGCRKRSIVLRTQSACGRLSLKGGQRTLCSVDWEDQ